MTSTTPRRLARQLALGEGLILAFHGIQPEGAPHVDSVHVTGRKLQQILDGVRTVAKIVPLDELVDRFQAGRSTRGQVAVTFDDAYKSLNDAADLLTRLRAPATVFVVTEAARAGGVFWWDRVSRVDDLATPAQWKELVAPDIVGLPAQRDLGRFNALRAAILQRFNGRLPDSIDHRLRLLETQLGLPRHSQRAMTFDELSRLAERAPIRFGVHTATHPALPTLSDGEILDEIRTCHTELRDELGGRVSPFLAVPYGLTSDRVTTLALRAGMACALGLRGTTVARLSDQAELQRFCVMQEEPVWKLRLRVLGVWEVAQSLTKRLPPRHPEVGDQTAPV